MSNTNIPERNDVKEPSNWKRCVRRGNRSFFLLLFSGGFLVVLAMIVVLWNVALLPAHSTNGQSVTTTSTLLPSKQSQSGGQPDPPAYWAAIQMDVAQGLHLTVAQVKAKLQGGEQIQDVAVEQQVTTNQLRTIELDAIQKGHSLLIGMHILTQQQSDQGMQTIKTWSGDMLNQHVTNWFLEH